MAPMVREVNTQFFKRWSHDMAYVLGFFAADGYMWMSARGAHFFGFQIIDTILLECIRDALQSNHTIATRKGRQPGHSTSYRLQIGSKDMYADLTLLGMTPAKSNTLVFPEVPEAFLGDFIRGYFDGDGSVYFRKHKAKDRKNPRWVFQSRFTSGSETFLQALHAHLRHRGVRGGFIYKKNRGHELVLSHHDSIALYTLMYNNARTELLLERKKRIFEKAIQTVRMRT